jgi:hypothetical protein
MDINGTRVSARWNWCIGLNVYVLSLNKLCLKELALSFPYGDCEPMLRVINLNKPHFIRTVHWMGICRSVTIELDSRAVTDGRSPAAEVTGSVLSAIFILKQSNYVPMSTQQPARATCRYSCVGNRHTFCRISLMLANCVTLSPFPSKIPRLIRVSWASNLFLATMSNPEIYVSENLAIFEKASCTINEKNKRSLIGRP